MRNVIIAVDGVDGVGKSSLLKLIEEILQADGHNVVVFSNPGGGSDAAFKVRRVMFEEDVQQGNDLFGMGFCQMELWRRIKAEYEAGKTILIDRWTLSTLAYQHCLGGLNIDIVDKYFSMVSGFINQFDLPLVDLHLTLHSDFETIKHRIENRKGKEIDKYEHLTEEWFNKINGCYLNTSKNIMTDNKENKVLPHILTNEQQKRFGIRHIETILVNSQTTSQTILESILPMIDELTYSDE